MHIQDIFSRNPRTTISFEFFPPKTDEGRATLENTFTELAPIKPDFVSVTYGAGGTTRDATLDLVRHVYQDTPYDPIPHLTCVCHQEDEIREILDAYADIGVSNILALGGDPPRSMPDHDRASDAFQYCEGLVKFIKEYNGSGKHPDPRGFGIGVAGFPEGHPATPHRVKELEYLKAKVDAGADYVCTQLFFDNRDLVDFRERCDLIGINVPIVCGIMPVTAKGTFDRLPELAGGSRYPAKLLREFDKAGDDEAAFEKVGIEWTIQQVQELLDLGPDVCRGVHLYTLNKPGATMAVCKALNLIDREPAAA